MSPFRLDHVVIRVPDPDDVAARIANATGLPVLRGWTPGGQLASRGVRFANGPFLDIFQAEAPMAALVLGGPVEPVLRAGEAREWRLVREDSDVFPWDLVLFRRRQGVLSALAVIDYDRGAAAWGDREFSGELFDPASSTRGSARLAGVEIAGSEPRLDDLRALGLPGRGDGFDLGNAILSVRDTPSGVDGVVALDVSVPGATTCVLEITADLAIRVGAFAR